MVIRTNEIVFHILTSLTGMLVCIEVLKLFYTIIRKCLE